MTVLFVRDRVRMPLRPDAVDAPRPPVRLEDQLADIRRLSLRRMPVGGGAVVELDAPVARLHHRSGSEVFDTHSLTPVARTVRASVEPRRVAEAAPCTAAVARMLLPDTARFERLPIRRGKSRAPAHQLLLLVPTFHPEESTS